MGIESKLTSKGQITIPAALRDHLALHPGDRLAFDISEDGTVTVRKATVSFNDLRGILKHDGPKPTPDEIVRLVDQARAGRAAKILENIRRRGS